ncbi:hypothetical protein Srufu_018890 [Streptomyces libani subsp. rufus]|nr:hypothetical protein Srufu_018890 [Streptomyces libani subsp. rufus]
MFRAALTSTPRPVATERHPRVRAHAVNGNAASRHSPSPPFTLRAFTLRAFTLRDLAIRDVPLPEGEKRPSADNT